MPALSPVLRVASWATVGVIGLGILAGYSEARDRNQPAGTTTRAQSTAPEDEPSRQPDKKQKPADRPNKKALGGRMLHGEGTVQTPDGFRVVFVQRGELTALSGSNFTVKSADGFTRSYTATAETKVHKGKEPAQLSDFKVGEVVVVRGVKTGDTYVPRMVGTPPERPDGQRPNKPRRERPKPSRSAAPA